MTGILLKLIVICVFAVFLLCALAGLVDQDELNNMGDK
jgi:hypothetical protein